MDIRHEIFQNVPRAGSNLTAGGMRPADRLLPICGLNQCEMLGTTEAGVGAWRSAAHSSEHCAGFSLQAYLVQPFSEIAQLKNRYFLREYLNIFERPRAPYLRPPLTVTAGADVDTPPAPHRHGAPRAVGELKAWRTRRSAV
ncbi:hypothetical protein EVAR_26590_1 [Eumeta japonica]|uniref:Uncharacterized protein n=1 Tax=Eumeta variegata TaxID=151549 RepID=A0A4C1W7M9_EUMVA|nr:hypothetical protein EVAR_26590_1 [Eumeta japonica]